MRKGWSFGSFATLPKSFPGAKHPARGEDEGKKEVDILVFANILMPIGWPLKPLRHEDGLTVHFQTLAILEIPIMKKMLAIAAIVASTQAGAFWGMGDGFGDGFGDGTMDFNMIFSGRSNSRVNGHGYGYNHPYYGYAPYYGHAPYYAPVAPVAPAAQAPQAQAN